MENDRTCGRFFDSPAPSQRKVYIIILMRYRVRRRLCVVTLDLTWTISDGVSPYSIIVGAEGSEELV